MFKFPFYTDNPNSLAWDDITNHFPWIKDMLDVPQDPIWHAEGNVNIHTKLVTQALLGLDEFHAEPEQARHILFATALMHDIEKRSTTIEEWNETEKRMCIAAPSHARKGERTARTILYKELNCPLEIREQICKMVRWHGVPLWTMDKGDPKKTVIESSLHIPNKWLAMFAKADCLGRQSHDLDDLLTRIEIFSEVCQENNVWDQPFPFKSDLAKFAYFSKEDNTYPDYEPFDDYKSEVIVLCGLPGAGKTTYSQKHHPDYPVLSLDNIRRERKIKKGDTKATGQMLQDAKEMAKNFLRNNTSFVWDATNLTKNDRDKIVALSETYRAKTTLVYIEPEYKTLLQQNKDREFQVPEKVINKYIDKLEFPSPTETVHFKSF